ncbi:hypothetical protein [Nocardioides aquiterrae]|uniref:Polysaccharide deacetylase n=1 Tax=Nocardioides aquiterrae TaxID=203799 RepID=A0ABP4FD55_9ACTN
MVDPRRAFHATDGSAQGYRDYMVTVREFRAELRQIYRRGYVLVHPERIARPGPGGVMRYRRIMLPPGKTPLVLSVDDVSYYEYMTGDGFATDLFVAPDGTIENHYVDARGRRLVGAYDVVPIVDDFVRAHPDFSYRGDKGTIALTGYNGVLGYRSSTYEYGDTPATRQARSRATVVATALKADGWHFANHTWGHIDTTAVGMDRLRWDTREWNAEVGRIVGPTREFVFPFGADISGVTPYADTDPEYRFLHEHEGYAYFFGVDATRLAWQQVAAGSLRQARIDMDGITLERALHARDPVIGAFFDPHTVVDPRRP